MQQSCPALPQNPDAQQIVDYLAALLDRVPEPSREVRIWVGEKGANLLFHNPAGRGMGHRVDFPSEHVDLARYLAHALGMSQMIRDAASKPA